ncbi:MAG TPA: class I SAM-dependent methyltransferase [Verrucomicrobiales bacterium]|nr:class I SAM-dependent methyltransferase [Verrucomicrobiales bacterium]
MSDTLYGYYLQQNVLPTVGHWQGEAELLAHEEHRRVLFTSKLQMPPQVFRCARMLEFGPDAGENSLVFALWGADCTLAEPNTKAHETIRNYFARFNQLNRLTELRSEDVLQFPIPKTDAERFDVIDAEGFIYTILPQRAWLEKCAQLTRPGGFLVVFNCEAYGSFMELMLKVILARYRALTGLEPLPAAQKLFQTKWDSIPHKRRIESWTMDVLMNPFVRMKYFVEPRRMCDEAEQVGWSLYSAWPHYADMLDIHWFKQVRTAEETARLRVDYLERSRLSHMFVRKHFLARPQPGLEHDLWDLLMLTDSLVDAYAAGAATRCMAHLTRIETLLQSADVISSDADREASLQTVRSYQKLFPLLSAGNADEIAAFCNTDPGFIKSWGTPSHFTVFQKTGTAAA